MECDQKCVCKFCIMYERVKLLESKLPKELAEEFRSIVNELFTREENASMENAVMKEEIRGNWQTNDGWYYQVIDGKRYRYRKGEVVE